MARPKGSTSTEPVPRKRLVQPVLPALPLIAKSKKQPAKTKEEENAVAIESAPGHHGVLDTGAELQPSTSVADEEESSKQEIETASVNKDNDQDVVEQKDLGDKADTGELLSAQVALGWELSARNENDTPSQDSSLPTPATKSFADDNFPINHELSSPPISAIEPSIALAEDVGQDNISEPEQYKIAPNGPISPGAAPEAVTGDVEKLQTTQHVTKNSTSNSSMQHTPTHGIAIPVSPEAVRFPQQQGVVNGFNHGSSSPSFINGRRSPKSHNNPASTAIIAPKAQPSFPTILDHICNLQYSLDGYDCDLYVYCSQSSKPSIFRNAHSLILVRSERLRKFIYPQRAASYPYYVINLAPARPIDASAFDAALKFLYADTVLSADCFFNPYTIMDKAARTGALDYAMSYMVAGLELGLEPVVTRALDIVGRLLDWDIAELAAKEATILRSISVPTTNTHAPPEALLAAKSLMQHVFNLIVLRLDTKQFKLDTESGPVEMKSRLSRFDNARAAINPALANMVFGSMPASADISPTSPQMTGPAVNSPDTIASIIMVNLEFEDLCALAQGLKSVHGDEGMRVIGQVVDERERRRLNVFNDRSIPNKQRTANPSAWDVIGLHEYIYDNNLRCERVGYLLPNSKRGGNN